ncbi:HNH endonuclease signature motif containing protein [Bacteroides reticulotermitis]|uniref:HNH endonuclease signature motif containing protein n=1 Tax=Bacteroides reticulotermitis TaxID=1133319 RepID=UPI003A88D4FE
MSRHPVYIKLINSTRWRDLRKKKLMSSPVCECCNKEGRSTPATEVHHITPVESVATDYQMKSLMFSFVNLMSICHECHVEIHRQMFSHTKESVQANNKRRTQSFADKYL